MTRKCTVCAHPDVEAINKALASDEPNTQIARRYSTLSEIAIRRHKANHLPATLALAQEAKEVASADNILAELRRVKKRVDLLSDACDRWLRDPDDPSRYEIGPRAEDVSVTYSFQQLGQRGNMVTVRKKARLSVLLKQINAASGGTLDFELVETKHADPRELVLKAAENLRAQTELLAKLKGELQAQPTVNVLVASPEWIKTRTVLLHALEPYPAAKSAVAAALKEVDHVAR